MPIRMRIIVMTIINSMSVNPAPNSTPRRFSNAALPARIRDSISISNPRSIYQSEYFVPSSAVAVDFEYTSNTFFPPQLVESGSSCTARSPHSARPVMGSTGIFRRKRIFRSLPAPSCTPFTIVSRSGGYPSLPISTRIWFRSAASLYRSIASCISRRSRRSSASFCRTMEYFAMGSAAEDRIIRMAHAMINSSSVIPASKEIRARRIRLPIPSRFEVSRNIARTIRLWLDLHCRFAGHQRYQVLLRIFRIHLYDRQVRRAGRQPLYHDSDQRSASAHSGRVRPARRRNNRLPFILERLMHDGDFLRSAGEESSVPDFFYADYRRVVLQQQRDGEEIIHVLNHNADRGSLAGLQGQALRFKAKLGSL